jgi:hypothetical protein
MCETPKVSVVIATYNRANFLPKSINSVGFSDSEKYEKRRWQPCLSGPFL